eukprot:TRINITY_DN36743_c0_g1_i1.p1 TRINITY_DN36743_c0_g1~~TRINITY_DN36743_c0_g1_i1.p1  ORF type:complete len:403 (+),score=40.50 TRINITY_DN36743_c0_g1_i1:76-1284(+)
MVIRQVAIALCCVLIPYQCVDGVRVGDGHQSGVEGWEARAHRAHSHEFALVQGDSGSRAKTELAANPFGLGGPADDMVDMRFEVYDAGGVLPAANEAADNVIQSIRFLYSWGSRALRFVSWTRSKFGTLSSNGQAAWCYLRGLLASNPKISAATALAAVSGLVALWYYNRKRKLERGAIEDAGTSGCNSEATCDEESERVRHLIKEELEKMQSATNNLQPALRSLQRTMLSSLRRFVLHWALVTTMTVTIGTKTALVTDTSGSDDAPIGMKTGQLVSTDTAMRDKWMHLANMPEKAALTSTGGVFDNLGPVTVKGKDTNTITLHWDNAELLHTQLETIQALDKAGAVLQRENAVEELEEFGTPGSPGSPTSPITPGSPAAAAMSEPEADAFNQVFHLDTMDS